MSKCETAIPVTADTEYCEHCGRALHPDRVVWLEMSVSKKWADKPGIIPPSASQGWFPFGPGCAPKTLGRSPYRPA